MGLPSPSPGLRAVDTISNPALSAWRVYRKAEDRVFAAWNARVDRRISLTLGSALVVFGFGVATEHVHIHLQFYALAAQIIPVLMLVGAVNGRYFREPDRRPPLVRFLIRGLWVMPLLGEVAALIVVARGNDTLIMRGLVLTALLVVGVIITAYAIYGPASTDDATVSEEDAADTGD